MRRREFIFLIGSIAALWPLSAHAQQPAIPVVGMLNGQSADNYSLFANAMRLGLKDEGFIEGQNVSIEYRWAGGHEEQLPAMAVELVNRHVAALVTGGSGWATISAKAATASIPIVFTTASDPIKLGYVSSLNRPGGNVTGVSFLASQLVTKRLELASQLVPKDVIIGFLGRPLEPRYAADRKTIESAAAALGRKILFFDIAGERDLESAFATATREHIGVLIPLNDPFFNGHRSALLTLASRHALPTIYEARDPVIAGGLMSYGTSITGAYRQAGVYVGRILKGENAGDLPVVQSTRFELVINLKTAKTLGLNIPRDLLVAADEVIE
jgi:putative tryptophan/tyrosine transport system substrate-binding protein